VSVGDRDWNIISPSDYIIFLALASILAFAAIRWEVPWLLVFPSAILVLSTIGRIATVKTQQEAKDDD